LGLGVLRRTNQQAYGESETGDSSQDSSGGERRKKHEGQGKGKRPWKGYGRDVNLLTLQSEAQCPIHGLREPTIPSRRVASQIDTIDRLVGHKSRSTVFQLEPDDRWQQELKAVGFTRLTKVHGHPIRPRGELSRNEGAAVTVLNPVDEVCGRVAPKEFHPRRVLRLDKRIGQEVEVIYSLHRKLEPSESIRPL
jgi:hypothetical protein